MRKIIIVGLLAAAPMFALNTTPASAFGWGPGYHAPRVESATAPRARAYTVCGRPYYRSHLSYGAASCRQRAWRW